MIKLKVLLIVNILFFASLSTYSSVQNERISSDSNWFAQLDCGLFWKSFVGETLKKQIVVLDTANEFEDFALIFGFNPFEDINSIMLYGQDNDRDKAVLMIEGKFDKERLLSLVGMSVDYKEISYEDILIRQWSYKDAKDQMETEEETMFGCFYEDDFIVLSSGLPALKDAINVLKGTGESTTNEFFKDSLLLDPNTFFQLAVMDFAKLVGNEPQAAVFKQTEQLIVGAGCDSENMFASVKLKAKSSDTAENIQKLLEGIFAWLSLAGDSQLEFSKLSQMIDISTNEENIKIDIKLNPEFILEIIESEAQKL